MAIYYEALCPDSMNFINQQLVPTYEIFKTFVDILFVPFGKSEVNETKVFELNIIIISFFFILSKLKNKLE